MIDTHNDPSTIFLTPYLSEIAVCPICKSDLEMNEHSLSCKTPTCGEEFRLVGKIPVLLNEALQPISFGAEGASLNKSSVKSFALRLLPSLDLNVVPDAIKSRLSAEIFELRERPVVLNIGGKHPTSITDQICGLDQVDAIECDLAYRPSTRLFANPEQIPLADETVDAVLLDAVLEHVPNPQEVVKEAWRVLKPNGIVYSDTPFMVQVHGGPFDYMRFSLQAHRWMFRDFEELEAGVSSGPGVALSYSIQYFFLSFVSGKWSRYTVKTLIRLFFFWIKYFDFFLAKRPAARDAAHGLYFMGRKALKPIDERELVVRYDGDVPPLYPPKV